MELSATGSYRQRNDVANVMAQLSSFQTIAPISVFKRAELEEALFKYFGKPESPKRLNCQAPTSPDTLSLSSGAGVRLAA
jgi:hypothetical protein